MVPHAAGKPGVANADAVRRQGIRGLLLRGLSLLVATIASFAFGLSPLRRHLPEQSAGTEAIVRSLVSAFDQADIVALGEAHQSEPDSELRIALIRNPQFAKKVHFIVVEFASTTEQSILDRFIDGEDVPHAQLEQVWKTTTQAENGTWGSPVYLAFFQSVRDVNMGLRPDERIRVLGGDPGPGDHRSREVAAVDVIRDQVLRRHAKALLIYGAAHFYRAVPKDYLATMGEDGGIVSMLEKDAHARILSVISDEAEIISLISRFVHGLPS